MKHIITPLLLCLCIAGEGCAAPPAQSGTVTIYEGSAAELLPTGYGTENAAARKVADGANQFSFHLSSELLKHHDQNTNFVCSPFSAWMPLSALVNATTPESKEELLNALALQGVSEADLNNAASRMLYDLTKQRDKGFAEEYDESYHDPLKIANAIFVSKDKTLKESFAKQFMDYYRGTTMRVDFKSDEAVKTINSWVNENTEGLIPSIVDSFAPDTIAAIANAIYFSDRWDSEFNPSKTIMAPFYGAEESVASFMVKEGTFDNYYEDEQLQAVLLDFTAGGGLYILLPKDGGGNELLAGMNTEYFGKIQSNMTNEKGKLQLPRFQIDSGIIELNDVLKALGVPLFDVQKAALTGGLIEESDPVYVSKALHQATIEVDEKGTTAAAVTILVPTPSAELEELPMKTFDMNCNRPFVFILCEPTFDGGNQILFTGVVNQPDAAEK